MNKIHTRLTIFACEIIKGDVVLDICSWGNLVAERDVEECRFQGAWGVEVTGDNEDGECRREHGEPETIMLYSNEYVDVIREVTT